CSRAMTTPQFCSILNRAAVVFAITLTCIAVAAAQTANPTSSGAKPASDQPLTQDERSELLKLIRQLQDRVEKLEAGQSGRAPLPSASPSPSPAATGLAGKYDPS